MTTVTISPRLSQLSDDQLREAWSDGAITYAELEAECERRDQAKRAAAAREQAHRLAQMRWHDAAHAQFSEAESACRGVLLSARGLQHGPADAFGLWSGPWSDVERYASEELLLWFQDHPRLTFQAWQRQGSQAAEQRRARDERDLAAMPVSSAPETAPQPTVPPMTPGSIVRFTAALEWMAGRMDRQTAALKRQAADMESTLARILAARGGRLNGGNQR